MRSLETFQARCARLQLLTTSLVLVAAGCSRERIEESPATKPAAASLSPGPSGTGSAKPRDTAEVKKLAETCDKVCEFSRKLSCKRARECEPNCMAMGSLRSCLEPVAAMYACMIREPVGHWECAEDGVAAIREGYCDAEQERAIGCMERTLTQ
jgi:hypothetical protein